MLDNNDIIPLGLYAMQYTQMGIVEQNSMINIYICGDGGVAPFSIELIETVSDSGLIHVYAKESCYLCAGREHNNCVYCQWLVSTT